MTCPLRAFVATACVLLVSASPTVAQQSDAGSVKVPEGFEVRRIYEIPSETQGSWVALAPHDRGLIAADQYGELYDVTLQGNEPPKVEPLNIGVGHAQGLLITHDALYIVVNQEDKSGLYRSRPITKDGEKKWSQAELLIPFEGAGEHGPHAVILAPDRQSLLICAGNHTKLPKITSSRVPQFWDEDLALERLWDPRGHATGIVAPGGWICNVALDGSTCELFSIGFRNEYDLALNRDGELFTFDADMEWDAGTAWYRPTRILHATSGADFGWRGGTGKWPTYYPDSLPAVAELGPGSPTGITFGTGAKFPRRYQTALFAADWSYGRIHALHLEENGSTYTGQSEVFASAAALPVTDMVVRPADGNLYFATGGRRLQSALYCISYTGTEETRLESEDGDVDTEATVESKLRKLRQDIEQLHNMATSEADVDVVAGALPYLGHEDRFIRYAARTAIELQPSKNWIRAIAKANDTNSQIEFAITVARSHTAEPKLSKIELAMLLLGNIEFDSISRDQQLALLRAYCLLSVRTGNDKIKARIVERFSGVFPVGDRAVDRELSRALAHAISASPGAAKGIVPKLLSATLEQPSVEERTHYLFALSTIHDGWDADSRDKYFAALANARKRGGGKSFGGYIDAMANRSLERMNADDQSRYQTVVDAMIKDAEDNNTETPAATFVREWTAEEVYQLVEGDKALENRDLANGRNAFAKASCFSCHQIHNEGGVQGPSLTTIGSRFSIHDLAETIVDPDREISDQYAQHVFEMESGETLVGRVVNLYANKWEVATDMMNPGQMKSLNRTQVESVQRSKASPMPQGLLNSLKRDEVLDLFAYLVSLRGS